MKRSTRKPDLEELLRHVQDDVLRRLRCATPGIIEAVNANGTVRVQPALMEPIDLPNGSSMTVQLPLLDDVPLVKMSLGGFSLTMPAAVGNEVLVIFSDRCFDNFWVTGKVATQAEVRFHDLSDGFAIPTKISQVAYAAVAAESTTSAQLRLDDGSAFIEITAMGGVNILAPGGFTVNGNSIFTGTLMNNSKNVGNTHMHSGVQTGSGTSGGVV